MSEPRDEELVVVRGLSPDARPSWSDVTSAGVFRVEPNGRFDLHYHDCDEYWLVFAGHARVLVGSRTHDVEPGDIVCTPAGTDHDVVGVRETLEASGSRAARRRAAGLAISIGPPRMRPDTTSRRCRTIPPDAGLSSL